jgi:hypothetical protein
LLASLALLLTLADCAWITPTSSLGKVVDADSQDRTRIQAAAAGLVAANGDLCDKTIGVIKITGGPDRGCKLGIRVMESAVPDATVEDTEIRLTTGLLQFVQNNDELMVVIAHLMGHMIRQDVPDRGLVEAVLNDRLGVHRMNAPDRAFNPAEEAGADRVSMFLVARADRDPDLVIQFWRRMASLRANGNGWLLRHPPDPQRLPKLEEIAAEIKLLREHQQALVP